MDDETKEFYEKHNIKENFSETSYRNLSKHYAKAKGRQPLDYWFWSIY